MTSTPAADAPGHFSYRPALDGLRALAVIAVVVFHLDETGLTGGFLGVDAFFVLSGFLITTLLVLEWRRHDTIGTVAFWGRRARRLLPALILLMVGVAVFARIEVPTTELGRIRSDGIAGLFYVANWRFVLSGQSYFDLFSAPSPFRHLWSLAIEEQFYLVWPLVTIGCLRWGRGRLGRLAAVTAGGTVVSVALMAALFNADDPSRSYYGTDTHAHTILVGALLALALVGRPRPSERSERGFALVGVPALLATIAAFVWAHDASRSLYFGGSLAFAIAVAALIASLVLAPTGPIARLFAFRPFVAIGVISYGIYLWHWPVIVYATEARVGLSGAALDAFRIALTLAFSIASFFLVERPIRARLRSPKLWITVPAGLVAGTVAILLATVGATAAPNFFGPSTPVATSPTTLGPREPDTPAHVVMVGDSLAASLGPGLDDAMTERGIRFEAAATPGCSILRGVTVRTDGRPYPWSRDCDTAIAPALRTVVTTEPRPDLVIWLSTWDAVDRILGGRRVALGTPEGDARLRTEVERAAGLLSSHGARLIILTVPKPVPGSASVLPGLDEAGRIRNLNALYESAAAATDGRISIIDLAGIVCPDGKCATKVHGVELRPDGSHFSKRGSAVVGQQLTDAVLACWRDPAACGP
ncbi:MAG: acyltransferase [Acidimicrobiia bacterium]|nr:acyltransferase [Acidimicrobiia bacterium]